MNLIGERIILRAIELADKEILLELINDETIERNLYGWSFPVSDLHQETWIRALKPDDKILRCMIVRKEDHQAVGTVILTGIDYKNGNAEVNIKLSKNGSGNGYAGEALGILLRYAFQELRLHCIYARVIDNNKSSPKSLEKYGFKKEGILRNRVYKEGNYHDLLCYSLLKEEYDALTNHG